MVRIMDKATTQYTRTATTKARHSPGSQTRESPQESRTFIAPGVAAHLEFGSSRGQDNNWNLSILRSGQKVDTVNEKQASEQKGLTPCNTAGYEKYPILHTSK